ncbi:MAG: aspartate-semialdehyde dehydrogenase [Dehalococcoidales bacterium]|nr:aspartate-semialdehyde dehydrogenase [Dehalococcoidales bacterium]
MLKAAVIGATGIVGQQFLVALHKHPWIKVAALAASERSAGRAYKDALTDEKTGAFRWFCEEDVPTAMLGITVQNAAEMDPTSVDVIFSAIESDQAKVLEPKFAVSTPVISTASAFRYEKDVPILIPGINSAHAALLNEQRKARRWKGFITPDPNCTTIGLAVTLKPIYDAFGIRSVIMTSMQAMSGAGRSPGVLGLDILDNVIPYIVGEEEKVQKETQKILGGFVKGNIVPAKFAVSCTCTRVNVREGHTEAVFVSTEKSCEPADVARVMQEYTDPKIAELPSAPKRMIVVNSDPFRPQPRLDRDAEGGMATTVGRIRKDTALENGIKYMLVSHNTKMGAAKGAVLVAEMLIKDGYIAG